jgi:hypothetical protein
MGVSREGNDILLVGRLIAEKVITVSLTHRFIADV